MIELIAAALIAAQPALPGPQTNVAWEELIDDADGRILIDPASIRREGDRARFHIRMISKNARTEAVFAEAFMAVVLDCRARAQGFEAGRSFDREGRELQSRSVAAGEVELSPIGEGSAEALYHRRACR
jgi:hypothetical protein